MWFRSEEAFVSYREDPRRTAFQYLLSESGAAIELHEVRDVENEKHPA